MTVTMQGTNLEKFLDILRMETRVYARLVRLNHRQRRYMIRRDSPRLEEVSRDLTALVPEARKWALRREEFLGEFASANGMNSNEIDLKTLTRGADNGISGEVREALAKLARWGGMLYRRNFQNHQLAKVSLDLITEEMWILSGDSAENPGYGEKGNPSSHRPNGVVNGRA